ncbi:MAG: Gfo/Idh/MocA family oxidoreductase [Alphaproteobacteria bacterium]|nr:Gfo/Idh/MocA family oxidoreductase [Alphaproteobacteria bacterium]
MTADSETLSTMIIGCGDIAGGYDESTDGTSVLSHAGAYRADGRFDVVACIDPDAARRRAFMDKWDIMSGFGDLDECLKEQDGLDVASICSPTHTHEAVLTRLLASSAQIVFCEKPMTGDPARSEDLDKAYKAAGKSICVNYLRRWDHEMTTLRDELTSGDWGELRSVTAFYAKGLFHTGSHMLDLIQFLIGPLTPQQALRQTEDFSAEDPTIDAVLTSGNNVPIYLIGSNSRDYARFEAEIACAGGVIRIEDSGFRVRRRRTEEHRLFPGRTHLSEGSLTETKLDRALAGAVNNIHGAATRGEALASDAETAISVERLCQQISELCLVGTTS